MTDASAGAADTEQPHANTREGTRFSARWRILGWLLLTAALGLAALIITVSSAQQAAVARDANSDISQELQEFRQFAREGVNPETAGPFTSFEPMINVFLRRQQAGTGEIMLGVGGQDNIVRQVVGPKTPAESVYDLVTDRAAMAKIARSNAGVIDTPAGELRWAKVDVVTTTAERGSIVIGIYTQPGYDAVAATTRLMIFVALGALLITALIGWAVAGQILRPIRTMRHTAAAISQEDLTRRIPVHGRDDLAELAETFNDMLSRLETAFATEQRFVDDAGHELRTPITIIRGHLELLSDDPAERQATLALVTQELDRMSRIVTDLLALAKSERPDFIQIDHPVDVAELTLDIDAKVQALAPRRWVLTHVAEGSASVDAQRVTQAMLQLAQNAVQHTAEGDEIRISSTFVTEDDGTACVQFAVTDCGPGVSAEDAEAIFERFARGTARRTGGHRTGAGLGLSIVRAIADGHRGSVFVDSVLGQGATFGLMLPRGPHPDDELSTDDDFALFDEADLQTTAVFPTGSQR